MKRIERRACVAALMLLLATGALLGAAPPPMPRTMAPACVAEAGGCCLC